MMSTVPHLTENQSATLQNRVVRIAEETNAAMILCFGVRTSHIFIRSIFLQTSDEVRSVECDLVILTSEREKEKRDKISETATKDNDAALKFTVLVHGVEAVNAKLKEGHPFFSTLFQNGEVLYRNHTFSPTVRGLSPPLAVSNIATYWTKRYDLASHFFQAATHALSEGWNDQAIFMLHQAVEHACTALIKVYLGYRASSHKLSQLLSLVENFSLHSVTVFPRITPEEIRLFNLLERAYSHARYDETYSVSTETVHALSMEVEQFLLIARALFNTWVETENTCTEKRNVSAFESIGLDTFARVILRQGEQESVEVESKYGSCESILVRNEDKRIWISTGNLEAGKVYDGTVYITYRILSGIVVHHADSCICEDPIVGKWFGVINNSSAQVKLNVNVRTLDVTANKHGKIILSGFADEGRILNNRSGEICADDLQIANAKVVIKGPGKVTVGVEDELYADLHGSGNLVVTGSPRIRSLITKGTGTLKISETR